MPNLSYKKPLSIPAGWRMNAAFHAEDSANISISVDVQNGIPPYKYSWSIEQDLYKNHTIISGSNSSTVLLEPITRNGYFYESGSIEKINSSLLKLDVEDSNNNKKTFYYMYSSKCYPIILPNYNREVTDEFCGSPDTRTGSVVFAGVNFLDNIENHISCFDLNQIACDEALIQSVEDLASKGVNFRAVRDTFMNHQYGNFLLDNSVFKIYDYTFTRQQLYYQELLNSASAAVVYKTGLREVSLLLDPQPRQYSFQWNQQLESLNNKSINDIIGNVDIEFIKLEYTADLNNLVGAAGKFVLILEDGEEYAWNPLTNSWDTNLADAIAEIDTQCRARRDAYIRSVDNFFRGFVAFLWGAYYFPLHRVKKEII